MFISFRQFAEPTNQLCRLNVKVTIKGHGLTLEFSGRSVSPLSAEGFLLNFGQNVHFQSTALINKAFLQRQSNLHGNLSVIALITRHFTVKFGLYSLLLCLVRIFASQSTMFQSCQVRSSLVEPALGSGYSTLHKNTTQ